MKKTIRDLKGSFVALILIYQHCHHNYLFVDGLALLLCDSLSHSLTLFLLRGSTILFIDHMASLIYHRLALLFSRVAAHFIDDIGALLLNTVGTLLFVHQIQNLCTNLLGNISTNFLKCGSALSVIYSLALTLLKLFY